MTTAAGQAQLQTYIEQEVATISPLKVRSELLKKQVTDLKITNSDDVTVAKGLRKDIIAHENAVSDMRLDITRQLNDVTKTLIAAERDVLAPAVEAKADLGKKVVAYEDELERVRLVEVDRVNKIIKALVDNDGVSIYQIRTLRDLAAYESIFVTRVSQLSPADAKIADVIKVIADVNYGISEQRDKIRRLDAESNEAKRRELERDAEKAKAAKEAEIAARSVKTTAAPKTGSRIRMTFEIVHPDQIPRELCVPSDTLIRAYINDNNLEHLDGVLIKRERVL